MFHLLQDVIVAGRNPVIRGQFLTAMTNKAPGNSLPILPVEVAVTGGRTYHEGQRSGFLGIFERLYEELTTAFVWLFGVKLMNDAVTRWVQKSNANWLKPYKALYADMDWSSGYLKRFFTTKTKPNESWLGISAMERYHTDFATIQKTLKFKSVKFAISVGIPLVLCGWVIPHTKQWMSSMILEWEREKDKLAQKTN